MTFGYDDASVMSRAKCGRLDEITYDYDGLNQRVQKRRNGLTHPFCSGLDWQAAHGNVHLAWESRSISSASR